MDEIKLDIDGINNITDPEKFESRVAKMLDGEFEDENDKKILETYLKNVKVYDES